MGNMNSMEHMRSHHTGSTWLLEGPRERLLAPLRSRVLHEGTIEGQAVNLIVVEPATKPSHHTLGIPGATYHRRSPSRQPSPP
jgi:hypothetical protein